MSSFGRYIGIDYSGAQTPTASLSGLRVYVAGSEARPVEITPPSSPRKYWSRRGVAEWLVKRLVEETPTLVGIDHGFSFPMRYFEATPDQHDAFCIAAWLACADQTGTLAGLLEPELSPAECAVAHVEGWILGVTGHAGGRRARDLAYRQKSLNRVGDNSV